MSCVMSSNEDRLAVLAEEIQRGNSNEVQRLLHEVVAAKESDLFNEMGHLTRKLHDSLRGFALDDRLADIAENELSDARARLNYVVAKTEESTHRTLDVIEEIAPLSQQLNQQAETVRSRWLSVQRTEMPIGEFMTLARELREFTESVQTDAGADQCGVN